MIGPSYWATGITCHWTPEVGGGRGPGWGASLKFYDDGFANDFAEIGLIATEGTLDTRYFVPESAVTPSLAIALNVLIQDAKKLGVEFMPRGGGLPTLYVEHDGAGNVELPSDWREVVGREAARLGWTSYREVMDTQPTPEPHPHQHRPVPGPRTSDQTR